MDVHYILKEDSSLTEDQIQEIKASRELPYVEDEDSPEIDPEKTPELYAGFLSSLAERNRKLEKSAM